MQDAIINYPYNVRSRPTRNIAVSSLTQECITLDMSDIDFDKNIFTLEIIGKTVKNKCIKIFYVCGTGSFI